MKHTLRFVFVLALACGIALSGPPELAGVLNGVVGDPSGTPMAGVSLTLRSPQGEEKTGTTDDAGQFKFSGLTPGEYTLVAKADGFKQAVVPVEIGTAPLPLQRVKMKIASANTELTVSATIDPVSADGNSDGLQVDKDMLKSLPVKEGNVLATAALFLDPAAGGAEGPKVVVDGMESSGLDVPESSIKKIFVNKNPYSAEFRQPGKGRIEVTTRPGSLSRIRKRVMFTTRDSALDARNAFARVKPDMNRQLAEAEIDGRLPRNAGTFYAGGDYLRDNRNAIVAAIGPAGPLAENVFSPQRDWRFLARTDFRLSSLHTLSFRYNRGRDARLNQGVGAFDLRDRGFDSVDTVQEFRVGETAILSPHFTNELRFSVKDRGRDAHSVTPGAAILVAGAFHAGGGQVAQRYRENVADLEDVAGYYHGMHNIRFGAGVKRRDLDVTDAGNFGGTFRFASLAEYLANRPLLYTVNQGNPAISFQQTEVFSFVQDEIRLRSHLGLLAGLRHFSQANVPQRATFAPRLALSYEPGGHGTVIRLGGGVFYDRQPAAIQQQAMLFDGAHLQEIVVSNPGMDAPLAALGLRPPSIASIAGNIRLPALYRVTAGLEQKLGKNNYVSVEYAAMRGEHLYRTRNLNAPLPGSELRPRGDLLNLNQIESSGRSRHQGVTVTFRTGYRNRFEMLSQYTLSRTLDDTAGMFALPADNYDLHSEFGRADFDRRHRFNAATIVYLPKAWKLGLIGSMASGVPYNITTGFDNNGDTVVNDRPAGVGRNTGRGPGLANADVRLSRRFYFHHEKETKSPYVELRLDAFNAFNRLNATNYVGTLTSPFYGRANSALAPRQLQMSAKVSF